MFEITEDGGRFTRAKADDDGEAILDALLDQRESGKIRINRYVADLNDLMERYPGFIDGHAHLGFALLNQGKPKLALEAFLHGVAIGEAHIPTKFRGRIE